MITRIVKLYIKEEHAETFEEIFKKNQAKILAFDGCQNVELFKDTHKAFYTTISMWSSTQKLDHYRSSAFFASIWPKTKTLFYQKPEAFSLNHIS